jgi:hypothetical protein
VDGTKIKASASKHKAMSYGRMQDEEARLAREIAGLLKQAESQDQSDEQRYGPDDSNGGLPPELKRRADRLKVIEQAKIRLEERARQADKADGRFVDEAASASNIFPHQPARHFSRPAS